MPAEKDITLEKIYKMLVGLQRDVSLINTDFRADEKFKI